MKGKDVLVELDLESGGSGRGEGKVYVEQLVLSMLIFIKAGKV